MSDETLSPDPESDGALLAAAYLDGLASPDERARVEASPQLMALVEEFRRVRDGLADVPPAPVGARERGIAAALAEFDRLATAPAAPVAPAASNVVAMRSRRWSKVLTAAAGLAIVGVIGVAALGSVGGSDSDSSSSGADPAEARTAVDAAGDAPLASQEAMQTSGGAGEGGAAETTAAGGVEPSTVATIGSIDEPGSPVPQLEQTSDLRSLPEPKTAVAPSFTFDCPLADTEEVLAEVTYQGTPAVVVRDTVTGVISAVDSQCTVLASLQP
ncbi:MAG: hypothetical protein RL238_1953 [Actinomycetota bacterium]|jgi:hypothetical protein